jgi:uncharacterized membrane protein
MAHRAHRSPAIAPHPIVLMLLAIPLTCFVGALLTDMSYLDSGGNLTWLNFSSWLLASGLAFGGIAGLALLISAIRDRASWIPFGLLLAAWIVELLNSFVHARDGWTAVSPTGLILSIIAAILVLASAGAAVFRRERIRGDVA